MIFTITFPTCSFVKLSFVQMLVHHSHEATIPKVGATILDLKTEKKIPTKQSAFSFLRRNLNSFG
jgi:hypothetical protein